MKIKKNKYYKKVTGPNTYEYRYILSHIPDDDIFLTAELTMDQYYKHPCYTVSFNIDYNILDYEKVIEINQKEYENIVRIIVMNIYNSININININNNNNNKNKYYKVWQYTNPFGMPHDYLYYHVVEDSLNNERLIINKIQEIYHSLAGDLYPNNPFGSLEVEYSIINSPEKYASEFKDSDEISQEEYETFVKKLLVNIYNIVNIHKNKKLQL